MRWLSGDGFNDVPVADGMLYPFFGILLSQMIAGAVMAFSAVSVITNALRQRKVTIQRGSGR